MKNYICWKKRTTKCRLRGQKMLPFSRPTFFTFVLVQTCSSLQILIASCNCRLAVKHKFQKITYNSSYLINYIRAMRRVTLACALPLVSQSCVYDLRHMQPPTMLFRCQLANKQAALCRQMAGRIPEYEINLANCRLYFGEKAGCHIVAPNND